MKKPFSKKTLLTIASIGLCFTLNAQTESAFRTPTMGWSSWNTYAANISEDIIKQQADAMASQGFLEAGYQYLNIDDGYFMNRDQSGRLIIHPTRFPNGMKSLVDYIHSKGLKAGCYSDGGHNTCASYWGNEEGGIGAGMYEHEVADCEMYFNEFGFDFIKVDFCGGVNYHNSEKLDLDPQTQYTAIRKAIDATGRTDIVYNVCRWAHPGTWVMDIADSWRISQDIEPKWSSVKDIIAQSLSLSAYCKNGHYNDMDMLEVGKGMTADEDLTHFGMWCILSSPLLIGCDLATVSESAKDILTNSELIALNQDPLALQAYVAKKTDNGVYVLVKDIETLNGCKRAIAIYNPTDAQVEATFDFADVNLAGKVALRDLGAHANLGDFENSYSVTLAKHASQFLVADAQTRLTRRIYEGETGYIPTYQETVNNEAAKTGIYPTSGICSGGAHAGWLGYSPENNLQWSEIYVPKTAEYKVKIAYICGEDRIIDVYVNDNAAQRLSCNSGGWGTVGYVEFSTRLNEGNNKIVLRSDEYWMPDIDYIEIDTTGAEVITTASVESVASDAQPADPRVINLKGQVVNSDGDLSRLPSGVYIHSGKKIKI